MNERILALDVGDARIGVAVSDASRLIASPVEVIHRVGFGPDVKRVRELCDRYETTLVLSGLPYNMDGTLGFQAEKVQLFCQQLEKVGLTVYYQDERLTTVTAEHALLEDNMHRRDRRQNVDKVAAAVILQQWLDTQRDAAAHESEEYAMEENENLVELVDDETGETVYFEHLATIEHEGGCYICLAPVDENGEENEDGEVVIMEIQEDDAGEDCYVSVEDEDTLQAVFEKLVALSEEACEDED